MDVTIGRLPEPSVRLWRAGVGFILEPGATEHHLFLRVSVKPVVKGESRPSMTQVKAKPTKIHQPTPPLGASPTASAMAPHAPPEVSPVLDEVEAVARIGSYSTDFVAGRWVSSKGLDAIFGIDAAFKRSVEGWVSLIHQADREMMVAYLTDEVLGRRRPFDKQYRIVRPDTGEERWVHGRGTLELDGSGRPVGMFGTIADISDLRATQDALIASELRYRAIFEGTAEAILIAEAATRRFRWVNSAACALLGYTRDELLQLSVPDIHPAQDLPMVTDHFRAIAEGHMTVGASLPCLRKDGTILKVDIRGSQAVVDGVACNIGFFTDVTELRQLEARDRLLAQAVEGAGDAIMTTNAMGEIEFVNAAFERLTGRRREELVGTDPRLLQSPRSRAVTNGIGQSIAGGARWTGDLVLRRRGAANRLVEAAISPFHDAAGAVTGYVAIERDVTDERALAAERQRLVAAVEQTSDPVIIADLKGTIEYVNPAFERVSGYGRAETIGRNPRMSKSGRQSAAFYVALWRRLLHGQTWNGTLVNRRKDGSLYEVEATISPLRGPRGRITGYVGVQRDVTALRAAESGLANEFRERSAVAAALAHLQPGPCAEATAADICDGLLGLPGIDVVGVINFLDPRRAVPLAVGGPDGIPFAAGRPLPAARASYLYQRAMQGPWAEAWRPRPQDGRYGEAMAEIGVVAIAYAPIRNREGLIGVLAAGTLDQGYASHVIGHLPAVGEFAAAASALLGDQLERERRDDGVRQRIRRALANGGLKPVFQPIVELGSRALVGYEALTRFADGTPPDRMIGDAHSVGMGVELEVACLAAGLEAAQTLPQDAWLSLNVSPRLILHSSELAVLLADRSHRIVLEVTEHAEIDDYVAVRRAIAALGPTVSLAIDDAGAGVANLHHIVELAPRFLKLDLSLVRHIDRDLSRQAMIAGLVHFAARTGCEIIAEGIEDRAELEILRELGVLLGQGYLLGRPQPIPAMAEQGVNQAGWSATARRPLNESSSNSGRRRTRSPANSGSMPPTRPGRVGAIR